MKKFFLPMTSTRLICMVFLFAALAIASEAQVLRAGAYMSNITPPLGKEIVGNWNSPPATHVHDELHAKCLVLDDGTTKIAMVVVDNVGIRREVYDVAKKWITEETGIEADHILMAATHTHSGISASGEGNARKAWQGDAPLDDYQIFVARRMADGVRIALNHMEPARIGWGAVDVPQHVFNRRWLMREPVMNPLGGMDRAKMNPGIKNPNIVKPAGPIDPEVSFIAVESLGGTPIAVLANYSLHYVGGVPRGHVSADYFAIFADRIQELLGADRQTPGFVGIMTNGTSGDVNNINFAGPGEKHLPYAKMNIVANDVAKAVHQAYEKLEFKTWVPVAAAQAEVTLTVRRASQELLANMEAVRAQPDDADPLFSRHEKIYAKRIKQLEEEWPDEVSIILQTFRIGDLGIATSPFETFAETGLEIKERAPFKDAFTIELANGSYGYLPTPPQHELGGYETWLGTNRVEKEATVKMMTEWMRLFKSIEDEGHDQKSP